MIGADLALPLYKQLLGILRQRIQNGTYLPGERIQTEADLTLEFKVSRATVRQAVVELAREGLVERKQGLGTFVTARADQLGGQHFYGSLPLLEFESSRAGVKRVELIRNAPLPRAVQLKLGTESSAGVIIRRARTMEGRLFAYTVNFLPERFRDLISEKELEQEGVMHLLERKGVRLLRAEQSIRAQLADPDICSWLEIDFGSAMLFAERTLFGEEDKPVEVVHSWYRGDAYEYTVNLQLSDLGSANATSPSKKQSRRRGAHPGR